MSKILIIKYYVIFIIIAILYPITVFSQKSDTIRYPFYEYIPSKPNPPLDTNVVYTEFRDYVLRVKIIEKCTCNYYTTVNFISLDKNNPIYAITPAYFLRMEVIERIEDFSSDSIPDNIISNIKYLLIPSYLIEMKKIPYNIPINIIANRGINYDYLQFVYIVSESAKFEKQNPRFGGTEGLQCKGDHFPGYLYRLFNRKIISYKTLLKLTPRNKNSKNIERCLKELKKKDSKNTKVKL